MISKEQLIEHIQQINRSARRDWLAVFDVSALQHYLDHLLVTIEPRGGTSRWLRTSTGHAAVTRRPRS